MTKRTKRRLLAGLYVGFLGAITVGATWVGKVTSSLTEEGSGGILQVFQGISDPKSQFPNQDRFTVLLVGRDYNRDRKGIAYTKNSRADTIMLMSVDLENQRIGAVSIPRDTKVRAHDGRTGKINGTMSRGGIELLSETIEEMFDVNIDYHVVIKPDAVKEIVDSLGGVEVESIDEMHYDDNWGNLHIHLPKGRFRVDGEQAVGYTRFREVNRYRMDDRGRMIPLRNVKSSLEEGDYRRMARQQQLIRAMVAEANRPGNLWRADAVIDTGFRQLETNFKRIQMMALATLFRGASDSAIVAETLEGEETTQAGAFYIVLDEERAKATVDWLVKGDMSARNRLVRVAVYNASGIPGAARRLAERLRGEGFDARSVGNAEPTEATSIYYLEAAIEERARAISGLAGGGDLHKQTEDERQTTRLGTRNDDIVIVVGPDVAPQFSADSIS
jgi:LCP family protein required for cell wall assembly